MYRGIKLIDGILPKSQVYDIGDPHIDVLREKLETGNCFHCHANLVPEQSTLWRLGEVEQAFCCAGCAAAAQAISSAGLGSYYRQRQAAAPRAGLSSDQVQQLALFDHPAMQRRFVREIEGDSEANLMLEDVACPACLWLIEKRLGAEPGVSNVSVNYESERARVRWRPTEVKLSQVMAVVQSLGYGIRPFDVGEARRRREAEQRQLLLRLGVAGLFGMQSMLLAVAVYLGEWSGIDAEHRVFMNWVGGLVTLPVFFYSGQPFFRGAWRALRRARATMDVPVSLGMCAAMVASVISLLRGEGAVYFDSIAMFCFFLLSARYIERRLSGRAVDVADRITTALPVLAQRLDEDGQMQRVSTAELVVGDRLQVPAGETIPADGLVLSGESAVDESLLSGESVPRAVAPGASVVAGSVNTAQTLIIRALSVGEQSTLSQLARLLDGASAAKPALAEWAGQLASYFSAFVLLAAAVTAGFWLWRDAAMAWQASIAVLVVSCPCALALAVPSAIANANSALARRGLLILQGGTLQGLTAIEHIVFDKTGTLTLGQLSVGDITWRAHSDKAWIASAVLALESGSAHPVARALWQWAELQGEPALALSGALQHRAGLGVQALSERGLLRLGTAEYLREQGVQLDPHWLEAGESSLAILACDETALACFQLIDQPREQAQQALSNLSSAGVQLHLYSGDRLDAVAAVAARVGIEDWQASMKPEQKLQQIQALQRSGAVMMVGDGMNDAASLAGASVSVAMGTGAAMALQNSDAVLTTSDLSALPRALRQARRTRTVVWQNIAWALCYNALAIPLAATGYLQPWMAAIGMSLSSLLVVLNAARLQRLPRSTTSLHKSPRDDAA